MCPLIQRMWRNNEKSPNTKQKACKTPTYMWKNGAIVGADHQDIDKALMGELEEPVGKKK